MYHLQLRQFPHNLCRFNLTAGQLRLIVEPWANDHWVELGERKWSPHQAKLTILEGPQIPLEQLSMGRGWRAAQRGSDEVTERVLAAASRTSPAAPGTPLDPSALPPAPAPPSEPTLLADSLALELLSLLERAAVPLSQAWRLAQTRLPDTSASESLALAEKAVSSLLRRRLIVLAPSVARESGAPAEARVPGALDDAATEPALRSLESWLADGQRGAIDMRRA